MRHSSNTKPGRPGCTLDDPVSVDVVDDNGHYMNGKNDQVVMVKRENVAVIGVGAPPPDTRIPAFAATENQRITSVGRWVVPICTAVPPLIE